MKVRVMNPSGWYLLLAACLSAHSLATQAHAQSKIVHPVDAALRVPHEQIVSRQPAANDAKASELDRLAAQIRSARVVRTIGTEDGDENEVIGMIAGVAMDANERILVLDRSFNAVRLYSNQSTPLLIGRKGNGPLDFRAPVAIWPEQNGRFGVADAVLGIKIVDASSQSPRLERIIPALAGLTSACRSISGFALYRAHDAKTKLVQLLDTSGKPLMAFGQPYSSSSALVSSIMSEGVAGCASNGVTVYAIAGLPYLHGYSKEGKRLWTLRVKDFVVPKQQETEDSKGRHSIGIDSETRDYSLVMNIVGFDASTAVFQVIYRTMRSTIARKEYERVDTYIVDVNNGRSVFIGSNTPFIGNAIGKKFLTYSNDPFPQVQLMEMSR